MIGSFQLQDYLSISGGILTLIALLLYWRSIIWGNTRPHPVTWWVWFAVAVLIELSHEELGGDSTKWIPIALACGMGLIAVTSIWIHDTNKKMVSVWSICGAIVSFVFYYVSKSVGWSELITLILA